MIEPTPGPWTVHKARDVGLIIASLSATYVRHGRVFPKRVAMTVFVDGETEEANANLIAASPDMLKELHAAVKTLGEVYANTEGRDYLLDEIDRIRAVIRKAEGRA